MEFTTSWATPKSKPYQEFLALRRCYFETAGKNTHEKQAVVMNFKM